MVRASDNQPELVRDNVIHLDSCRANPSRPEPTKEWEMVRASEIQPELESVRVSQSRGKLNKRWLEPVKDSQT